MKTTSLWCCSKCLKVHEIVCTDMRDINAPPNQGKCEVCGGELDRGLQPKPTRKVEKR